MYGAENEWQEDFYFPQEFFCHAVSGPPKKNIGAQFFVFMHEIGNFYIFEIWLLESDVFYRSNPTCNRCK